MMKIYQFSEPALATVDVPADKRHDCVAQISLVVIRMIVMIMMIFMRMIVHDNDDRHEDDPHDEDDRYVEDDNRDQEDVDLKMKCPIT